MQTGSLKTRGIFSQTPLGLSHLKENSMFTLWYWSHLTHYMYYRCTATIKEWSWMRLCVHSTTWCDLERCATLDWATSQGASCRKSGTTITSWDLMQLLLCRWVKSRVSRVRSSPKDFWQSLVSPFFGQEHFRADEDLYELSKGVYTNWTYEQLKLIFSYSLINQLQPSINPISDPIRIRINKCYR